MAVGFSYKYYFVKVGMGDFLHSFFSTIAYRLENGDWGSKYPYLMRGLYWGKLEWRDIKFARSELKKVQTELKKLPRDQVIWDFDDLSMQPPWGDNISEDVTDMSNYYVTSDGQDLITVIFRVFDEAERMRESIEIQSL